MYKYKETRQALKDWEKIKSMSKSTKDKWKYLFVDILDAPRNKNTVGSPEELKHYSIEMWSRELTQKDRIVYGIEPGSCYNMPEETEIVIFYQYLGHYADK
jgi:Txe/YoeB family toxin of Txe-Axe toxin-antitoxin module